MNSSYKLIDIFSQESFQTKLSKIALLSLEISLIQKLLSEKGKAMVAYDRYVYALERTMTNKLIFRCHNRDCQGKVQLIVICRIELNINIL